MFVHYRKNRTHAVREGQVAWKKLGGTVASVNKKESSAQGAEFAMNSILHSTCFIDISLRVAIRSSKAV